MFLSPLLSGVDCSLRIQFYFLWLKEGMGNHLLHTREDILCDYVVVGVFNVFVSVVAVCLGRTTSICACNKYLYPWKIKVVKTCQTSLSLSLSLSLWMGIGWYKCEKTQRQQINKMAPRCCFLHLFPGFPSDFVPLLSEWVTYPKQRWAPGCGNWKRTWGEGGWGDGERELEGDQCIGGRGRLTKR